MYAQTVDQALRGTGTETFEAIDMLRKADPSKYQPENGADYPKSRLGQSLQQVGQLIKSDIGVEVLFVDCGGWDNHVNEGGVQGQLSNLLKDLGQGLCGVSSRHGRSDGEHCFCDHERIRAHRKRKREPRDGSRPRELHVRDGWRRERRPRVRQMARAGGASVE